MVGVFGQRGAGVEGQVGELINLLGLSAGAEDEETAGEAETEKDEHEKGDKKFDHGWGHGRAIARAVSDDECGNDGHCRSRG